MKKLFMLFLSAIMLSIILAATCSAATYTVTNVNDAGGGSLRRAINDANGNPGADIIDFNIFPYANIYSIQPVTALPAITEEVFIDGFTQSVLSGTPDTVYIEVSGLSAGGAFNGLRLTGGSNVTIRGIAVNNFANNGIRIETSGNTIYGCMIGVGTKGVSAKPNGDNGILIAGGTNNNIGDPAQLKNVISGNTLSGVRIQAGGSGNLIQNNYLGLDVTGLAILGNGVNGVYILNSSSNTVGGTVLNEGNLISGNINAGITIDGASANNFVQGNTIGIASDGITALGNTDGIEVVSGANNNSIGGTLTSGRNFIGGNSGNGIDIRNVGSDFNTVVGNYIGLGTDLTTPVGNGSNGILIANGANNTIGGILAGEGNVIVNNGTNGVRIANASATLNNLYGNYIGVANIGGTLTDMGNANAGVLITSSAFLNYIGGAIPGQGNVISGNDQEGVDINGNGDAILVDANEVVGNYIGTDSTGAALGNTSHGVLIHNAADNNKVIGGNTIAFNGGNGITISGANSVRNRISANSIHSNTLLGIDLSNDGVDVNDVSDPDGGSNDGQNYPVITSVTYDGVNTNIIGSLNSTLVTNFDIELYSNTAVDPSSYGEGESYLLTTNVNTDAVLGDTAFAFAVAGDQRSLAYTTIARDTGTENTSEFSRVDTLDLAVTKTVNNSNPKNGDSVTYTVTVTNNGPDNATGVQVTDILPSVLGYSGSAASAGTYTPATGVWAVGPLLLGASATLTINGTVTDCGSANNSAIAVADQFDNIAANNSASASYTNNCPVAGGYREGSNLSQGIIGEQPEKETGEEELSEQQDSLPSYCLDYIFVPKDTDKISRYEFLYLMLQLNCFDIQGYFSSRDTVFDDLPRVNYIEEDADFKNLVTEVMYTGYDEGIISGYSDSTVKPYESIVFAEAAKMVFKSAGMQSSVTATGEWYEEYMNYLKELLGDNTLDPASTVTKAQADNIVDRIVNK